MSNLAKKRRMIGQNPFTEVELLEERKQRRQPQILASCLLMHPLDTGDRVRELREDYGIGLCNITKCCTKVCPENITITDNAIIPLKERVVDRFFDPRGSSACLANRDGDPARV